MGETGRLSARLANNISGKRSACQGRRHSRRSSERRVSGAETLDVRSGFCYLGILSAKKMTNWA